MMQKNYLNLLKSKSKKFAKKYNLFDVILYGSSVKGKIEPEDIDIALLFTEEKLETRRDIAYEFRKMFKNEIHNLQVETINLKDFFNASFFARQGILTEGYSLVYDTKVSNKLGFDSFSLFSYTLKKLNHAKKTSFTYSLIGRRGREGIIKLVKAVPLGRGALIVPIENTNIFEEFLRKWNVDYKRKNIFISRI